MLKSVFLATALTIVYAASSFAGTTITPTTTLAAETANTTSAAATFTTSSNGNVTPGNVSQENVHKLLYAGSTAKVYAHYLGWWTLSGGSHIHIGYDSATQAQAHSQISDMMNRGIDGLIIDWYGQGNTHIDAASQLIKQDAETRSGKFNFAIMEDQGAVRSCALTAGCDATQAVINDLNYINATYASSPAYMRINGQPVIFTFDTENLPNINWTTVMANVQGNPKIVLRNDQGFRISFASGSYAWVAINKANQDDWGQAYLDDFYATSRSYPNEVVYPGVWKGFNDTLASWSENRIMSQNCGQVWLETFNKMNRYFSTITQPQAAQLVTWNDYEEGTEIETGIDNCVSVSGAMSGSVLAWAISGQENTIDHYSVFISLDGQNLMKLADVAAGTHQLDLGTFGLAPANYTLYVKAIGMPSMLNKMSGPVLYTQVSPVVPFTVNVRAPVNGSTLGELVRFAATGTSSSPVTAMRIYVDNQSMYTVGAAALDTTLTLTPGAHYVVMQAWNSLGQVAKTPLNITVAALPVTAPPMVVNPFRPSRGAIFPTLTTASEAIARPNPSVTMRVSRNPMAGVNSSRRLAAKRTQSQRLGLTPAAQPVK